MTCTDIAPLLDQYVDGTLSPVDLARVDAHLAECDRCRGELDFLRGLLLDARQLPRSVAPPRDLWSGIAGRLPATPPRIGGGGRPRFQMPALIAAGLALVLLGGALATWLRPGNAGGDFAREQQRYAEASAALAETLATDPAGLTAATRAVVERNLAIVDQAIREAEEALARDRGNAALEQMLIARYEQRLSLLKRAVDAGKRES